MAHKREERRMKYLVFYTTGDFTGSSDSFKIVKALTQEEALDIVIKELDEELAKCTLGSSAYYENVRVYEAPICLAKFKGKDRRDLI
jgi:hypothetical protein